MAKFSGTSQTTKKNFKAGALKTKKNAPAVVLGEGAKGFTKGTKTELFTLAVTNMVGEATFYESAGGRDNRFVSLIHQVAQSDPEWIANFIPFLRDTAQMRSASVVCAVESARAISSARAKGVDIDVNVPDLIASACSRADEPAEVIGYWLANYGRPIPIGIRRGVARAATRLYNERSVLKYDGGSRNIRVGDVINLTHPTAKDDRQSALFTHALDRRYDRVTDVPETLTILNAAYELDALSDSELRKRYRQDPEALAAAGYTWERLAGKGALDAEAWEAMIPSMGYMATLRNLRNFEKAGVSKASLAIVRAKLEDPEEVANSRQFPYRFLSAFKATDAAGSVYFASSLETALDLSCKNIPAFPGRTLVMVDTSGSMGSGVSNDSTIRCFEIAGLFGSALAIKGADVTLVGYDAHCEDIPIKLSVLKTCKEIERRTRGGWTKTWPCTKESYDRHGPFDRICIFTDMQDAPTRTSAASLPANVPIYVWDVRGYAGSNINTNEPGRYMLGGFTDACFRMVPLLERNEDAGWPWEV